MNKKIEEIAIRYVVLALFLMASFCATAQAENAIERGFQWLLDLLTGNLARIIASLAVIGLFISGLSGRLDFTRAVIIIICIFGIFGVATIIDSIAGA